MNIRLLLPVIAVLSLFALSGCRDVNKAKSFEQMADRIRAHYVEDSRVDRFEILHKSAFKGLLVDGYTTIPEAYDSIQRVLSEGGFVVASSNFRLLPDARRLEGKTTGIITVAVANLRSKPGHSQELATQALLGTPIEVLDERNGWYLVRTPDRYLAWLEPGAFAAMRPREAKAWLTGNLRIYAGSPTELLAAPGSETIVSNLLPGNLVRLISSAGELVEVQLPDGTTGWTTKDGLLPAEQWSAPAELTTDNLIGTARGLQGRPYLWGGTSANAMDCSGFTKMAYYFNGYVIPRDASQQVHAGSAVELTPDFDKLETGDLLFFGGFREDGSEKVTHVGFYTGEGRFLHAGADNGRIREQSLRPGDADFAEHRLKTLLRARRLRPGSKGVVPVGEAFREITGR